MKHFIYHFTKTILLLCQICKFVTFLLPGVIVVANIRCLFSAPAMSWVWYSLLQYLLIDLEIRI